MHLQETAEYSASLQPDMKLLAEVVLNPSKKWSWISEKMRAAKANPQS